MISAQIGRLNTIIGSIDKTLMSMEGEIEMNKEEMFEVFGDFDPSEHEDETKERWGKTDAYKESARRTKSYTKEDWLRIRKENEANMEKVIAFFDEQVDPSDPQAMSAAEKARLWIDRNFYPCPRQMHVALGEMYVTDARFREAYDQHREGLAEWLRDAIRANAASDKER
jgi:hypothetical protein